MIKRQFLILTDDFNISQSIHDCFKDNLTTEIHCVSSLSQAINHAIKSIYHLFVIDLQLSGMDKMEMVRIFRLVRYIPILALTDPLDGEEKIQLFHSGVNAFLEKPINADVCLAQAVALLELYLRSDDELNRYAAPVPVGSSMVIAPRYRQALIEGKPISLTRKEFDLLYFLARHPGQVFSRGQLYEQVWDDFYELGGDASVKSHIKTLRKKLSVLGTNLIENVRGVGYRLIPPE